MGSSAAPPQEGNNGRVTLRIRMVLNVDPVREYRSIVVVAFISETCSTRRSA